MAVRVTRKVDSGGAKEGMVNPMVPVADPSETLMVCDPELADGTLNVHPERTPVLSVVHVPVSTKGVLSNVAVTFLFGEKPDPVKVTEAPTLSEGGLG